MVPLMASILLQPVWFVAAAPRRSPIPVVSDGDDQCVARAAQGDLDFGRVGGVPADVGQPAGRRLSDDPKAAWRTVAGLVLAGFVSLANFAGIGFSDPGQVAIPMSSATPSAIAVAEQQARELLIAAGVTATVRTSPEDSHCWANPVSQPRLPVVGS
jgi:hypothetical protein